MYIYTHLSCVNEVFVLYLMGCISYAYNILVVCDGIKPVTSSLGGLRADWN